jgi:hypothetical protein
LGGLAPARTPDKISRAQELCHDYAIGVYYPMQTVIETPAFLRRAQECGIPIGEREAMVDFLAAHPNAGDEMPGTGGARKVGFARPGEGKRGGYRVITFFSGEAIPVFLLSVFAKNEKSDLSKDEKNELKKLLQVLPETYRRRAQR